MNSLQIKSVVELLPVKTKGVFPADLIPKHWEKPAALVFNTDIHTKPGTHWVAIYVNEHGEGIYFDSFGLPPFIEHHIKRIRNNCRIYRWNNRQIQNYTSDVCGHYCVMFLHIMCGSVDFVRFCDIFTTDLHKNDVLVREYYEKFIDKNYKVYHKINEFIQCCCSKI